MCEKEYEPIGLYYRKIHNTIDRYFAVCFNSATWKGLKLTHSQTNIMRYLYEHRNEDVFQKDIEAVFDISGATASNTLKGMEKQNILVRVPMPEDARKKKISLTRLGEEAHEQAVENVLRMEATLIKGMSDEDITRFSEFLENTLLNLDKLIADCGEEK